MMCRAALQLCRGRHAGTPVPAGQPVQVRCAPEGRCIALIVAS